MSLRDYNRKRNFDVTAEPPGRPGASPSGHTFVVQKHAARRLHYDFRLELDGALKSWSVPKGPSFDPTAKRLAVAVEDHPIDYGGFEGTIPHGEYGGGTVLLWDRGTWQPVGDAAASLAAGHLKFDLFGDKLRGRWALVRLKARPNARGRKGDDGDRNWLLVKDRDAHARPESEWNVTEARPESVESGRDLPAIAKESDRVWHSNRNRPEPADLTGARGAPMPATVELVRARRARAVPEGDDWIHEIAIAGTRVMARASGGRIRLLDEGGRDRSQEWAPLVKALGALPALEFIVDAVATALTPAGGTSAEPPPSVLYLIDLLYLDGQDLRSSPLVERKALLSKLLASAGTAGGLRFADHIVGRGAETFAAACALHAPGVVSKRAQGAYRSGTKKAPSWRIVSCDDPPPREAGARVRPSSAAPARRSSGKRAKGSPPPDDEARIAGVKLTHPERMLYPEAGVTKHELARYYEDVAHFLVPYVEDRPLTLVRSPDGVGGKSFYVRHAGVWAPSELRQFKIASGTGSGTTMIADDPAGLVALAQMNVLEIHAWNARVSRLDQPDRMVFDLDPGPQVSWNAVVSAAFKVRDVLGQFDLESFVKTTGSKGLHVVVPLSGGASFTDTLTFSRDLAQALARSEPHLYSAGLAKAGREDKIFIDYLRNRRGATSVSVYSTRAQPTASVSVPIAWGALGMDTRSDSFHVTDRAGWFAKRRVDPWAGYALTRQKLTARHLAAAQAVARQVGKNVGKPRG